METLTLELAKVCSASTYVMEISGQLVQNFGVRAQSMVKQNLQNYFAQNLNEFKVLSESELLDATCFFCDFVEYANNQDEAMIIELNNKFIDIFKWTKSMDVKQTLSYGMGVFSMFIQQSNYSKCIKNVTNVRYTLLLI